MLFLVGDREEVSQLFGRIDIGCNTAWINLAMRVRDKKFAGIVEPTAIIVRHWHWHVGGRLDGKRHGTWSCVLIAEPDLAIHEEQVDPVVDKGALESRAANTDGALRCHDAIGIFIKVTSDEPERAGNRVEGDRGGAAAAGHKFIDGDLSIPAEHELGTIAEFELSKAGLIGAQLLVAIDRIGGGNGAVTDRTLTFNRILGGNGRSDLFSTEGVPSGQHQQRCHGDNAEK